MGNKEKSKQMSSKENLNNVVQITLHKAEDFF